MENAPIYHDGSISKHSGILEGLKKVYPRTKIQKLFGHSDFHTISWHELNAKQLTLDLLKQC